MFWMAQIVLAAGVLSAQGTPAGGESPAARRAPYYGMKALRSYRPNDPSRPTVCLVHGINSSSGGFSDMVPTLERAGFGVVVYDYPFNRDLEESAEAFVGDWKDYRGRVGDRQPWALVTHSMGGLLARYYVEGRDFGGDVSALILIGPPNAGSSIARAQPLLQLIESVREANGSGDFEMPADLGAAADDLLPGSRFLRRLAARPRREGVEYHILAGNVGFIDREVRRQVEARYRLLVKTAGVLGGLARLAGGELLAGLDELTDGTGDGAVTVASTRLDGVDDHVVIPVNHVELILSPRPGPGPRTVACMPYILRWLGDDERSAQASTGDPARD